jgi:N-acetylglucosamine-6-sulfatase
MLGSVAPLLRDRYPSATRAGVCGLLIDRLSFAEPTALSMTLKRFTHPTLRALAATLALGCAIAVAFFLRPQDAPAASRPNIVVIQTDDQTLADLYATYTNPLTGQVFAVMPNTLTLLAGQGITFNRYYVSNPLCCPSRTTLLTGRYSHNNGVLTNFFPSGGFYKLDLQNNLAVWLHNAGYKTSHVGKFLNQYGDNDPTQVPPGWDDWHTVIGDARLFYGYKTNDNGTVSDPHGVFDETDSTYPERDAPGCPDSPPPLQECNYLTDTITQDAENAINKYAASSFFVQVDYTTPHGDIVTPGGPEPATKYAGTFPGAKAPRLPNFNEFDMTDKPAFVRQNPKLGFGKIDYIDRRYENRIEALRSVDDGVAKIVNTLAANSLLENTYIVFISDNGFFQGEHRFDSAKFLAYEPSTHLPLVIRGPGILPNSKSGALVGNVDLAPTFLQWTGASSTATMDGRSLVPFIQDPAKRTKTPILLEGFTGKGEEGTALRARARGRGGQATISIKASPRDYEGVRIGRYKFIQYKSGAKELYDFKLDPYELHSRHLDPRYREVKRWLGLVLQRMKFCAAQTCKRPVRGKIPNPLPKHKPKPKHHHGNGHPQAG